MRFNPLHGLLALSLLANPAPAQTAPKAPAARPAAPAQATPETRADALTANMEKALGLTPAQVEKVRAINLGAVRSVENGRHRYLNEPAKLKEYVESVGISRLDRLKDVLTAAQFNKYQQKREEKMGIPTVRGNQGNPVPGLGGRRGEE